MDHPYDPHAPVSPEGTDGEQTLEGAAPSEEVAPLSGPGGAGESVSVEQVDAAQPDTFNSDVFTPPAPLFEPVALSR